LAFALAVLAASLPAAAANKDIERLQIQVASLQGQVADLQRSLEDATRELRRLNEQLAKQGTQFDRSLQDQRTQGESLQASLKELADRVAELQTRAQVPPPAAAAYTVLPAGEGPPGAVPYGTTQPGAAVVPGMPGPSGAAPAGPGVPGAPAVPAGSLPAPRELYSQAYADYARGNYDLAIQGFQEYLKNYPNTDFSDNAQYWVGEALYGKAKYAEALEAWKVLFRDYAASDKLPDGHVKSGMALEKLGRRSQALLEYRFVVDRYPNSQAARIARDRLNPQ
jgi:tol-pal system protein YbgF